MVIPHKARHSHRQPQSQRHHRLSKMSVMISDHRFACFHKPQHGAQQPQQWSDLAECRQDPQSLFQARHLLTALLLQNFLHLFTRQLVIFQNRLHHASRRARGGVTDANGFHEVVLAENVF